MIVFFKTEKESFSLLNFFHKIIPSIYFNPTASISKLKTWVSYGSNTWDQLFALGGLKAFSEVENPRPASTF